MLKGLLVTYKKEVVDFFNKNRGIIGLSLLYLLLKLPSLFEPYWYGDEGVTITVGMAIKRGLLLYRDVYDNKPPLLYLLASLVDGNLYFLKLISLVIGLGVFGCSFACRFLFLRLKNQSV